MVRSESFCGPTKRNLDLGDYALSLSFHRPGDRTPRHFHEFPYWSFPIRGSYLEKTRLSESRIDHGKMMFRPSGYEHENVFNDQPGVSFNVKILDAKLPEGFDLSPKVHPNSSAIVRILAGLIDELPEDEMRCRVEEFIANIGFAQDKKPFPGLSDQVKSLIRENYRKPLRLAEIAALFNISVPYLARTFKRKEGSTIGDYIRNVRSLNAYFDSLNDKKLTSVALENGFYDQSHFIRTFRAVYGSNPLTHRKNFRKVNLIQF